MPRASGVPALAAFQAPPYQAHDTPLASSRSPIVASFCGGSVVAAAGSA